MREGATKNSQSLKSQNRFFFQLAGFGNLDEILIRINSGNVIIKFCYYHPCLLSKMLTIKIHKKVATCVVWALQVIPCCINSVKNNAFWKKLDL
jgi:hypothetical protein